MGGRFRIIIPAAWGILIVASLIALARYQVTPGRASAQPLASEWPAAAGLPLNSQLPTLILFLHPQCPCSRATLNELNDILSRAPHDADVRVFVVAPAKAPPDFPGGPLAVKARSIPGITVLIDNGARLARQFSATTSGDMLLYSPAGRLLFKGGITTARGEEGDNDGMESVLNILLHRSAAVYAAPLIRAPVFGCPLEN